jgi:hypothetical protein
MLLLVQSEQLEGDFKVLHTVRLSHVDDSATKSILDHLESWRPDSSTPESRLAASRAYGRNEGRRD